VTSDLKHSLRSSEREEYVEYIFLAALCSYGWAHDRFVEVARSKTDAFGYDLVLSSGPATRHVQLKASRIDGKTRSQMINKTLANKTGGCAVWLKVDSDTLLPQSFGWLEVPKGWPTEAECKDGGIRIARQTRGNAEGVKAQRENIFEVSGRKFTPLASIGAVFDALFDQPAETAVA
jgi:hypothetical protein